MNGLSGDFMGAADRVRLVEDIRGLCAEADVARSVSLRSKGARSFAAGSGTVTYTEVETPILATVYAPEDSAKDGPTEGMIRLLVAADQLTEDPSVYERVVIEGVSYTITSTATDALGATWRFDCRKAA